MNFTPEQERAITARAKRVCVDAGAGSGKTRVLVERVLQLIERDRVPLERIAAITFTDNAASEMKDRLRMAFRKRGDEAADSRQQSHWRQLERRLDGARISTFHGFCMALLKQNALLQGMDPDFEILPDPETMLLREETVEAVVNRLLESADTAARLLAAEHGPRAVYQAVESLLHKRHLFDRLAPEDYATPEALLASWELKRVNATPTLMRWLSVCPDAAQLHARLVALDGCCADSSEGRETRRRALIDVLAGCRPDADVKQLAKAVAYYFAQRFKVASKKPWSDEDAYTLAGKLIKEAVTLLERFTLQPPDPETDARAAEFTCALYRVCREAKAAHDLARRARNACDFDDLIDSALDLLRRDARMRQQTARGIRHLLVDEFQDTDARQLEIAELLASEDGGPELFIVGDAKQSIYLFRGAEVEVFRRAQALAGPDNVLPLKKNFRSRPEILAFVNDFFARSGLLAAVSAEYSALEPALPAAEGPCGEFLIESASANASSGERRKQEAALIARRLLELTEGPEPLRVRGENDGTRRPVRYSDIAILFRSLPDVHLYTQALKDAGIPYTVTGGRGFYTRPEILDLRNLLAVVIDPCDEVALLGFLRGPLGCLSDDSLTRLARQGKGLPQVFSTETDPPDFPQAAELSAARVLIADLRAHRHLPLHDFLTYVLARTQLEAIEVGLFAGERRVANLRKLLDLALDFARSRPPRLEAFLRYLSEIQADDLRETEAALPLESGGAVSILTIHQAKGLEFPVVVVPDIARKPANGRASSIASIHPELGLFASFVGEGGELTHSSTKEIVKIDQSERERAEHARILYVAMTRAEDYLVLSGSLAKSVKGSWFAAFDSLHALSGAQNSHGAMLCGEDATRPWEFRVLREADGCVQESRSRKLQPPVHTSDLLRQRALPLAVGANPQLRCSATTLAHAIAAPDEARKPAPASPPPTSRLDPRIRGTLVHRFIELWNGEDDPQPLIRRVIAEIAPGYSTRTEWATVLSELAPRLHTAGLFTPSGASPPEREVPFVLRIGDALISGAIDALLPDGPLLDYKTGRPRPESQPTYEAQVLLYAAAMRALRGTAPSEAHLVYVDTGDLHRVSITPDRLGDVLVRAQAALPLVAKIRDAEVFS